MIIETSFYAEIMQKIEKCLNFVTYDLKIIFFKYFHQSLLYFSQDLTIIIYQ